MSAHRFFVFDLISQRQLSSDDHSVTGHIRLIYHQLQESPSFPSYFLSSSPSFSSSSFSSSSFSSSSSHSSHFIYR